MLFLLIMVHVVAQSDSETVRRYARDIYLKPAIQRGEKVFTVNVGAIHKALSLINRVPLVCAALKSRKFLTDNNLRLVSQSGPRSGQSTTVTFTYEILSTKAKAMPAANPLLSLRGAAKDVFRELGGGEDFIRSERNRFSTHSDK
jgi:hypothetical protein